MEFFLSRAYVLTTEREKRREEKEKKEKEREKTEHRWPMPFI